MNTLSPGSFIGPTHEVLEILDDQGSTAIYRCRHLLSEEIRVAKVLEAEPSRDSLLRDAFRGMAQRSERVQHPQIVAMEELLLSGDSLSLVMPAYDAPSLEQALDAGLALERAEVLTLCHALTEPLLRAQQKGLAHGELSPGHLLLQTEPDGTIRPLLLDFGVGELRQAWRRRDLPIAPRNLAYLAPEVLRGEGPVGPPADVYSLAVLACRLLTGRPPFPVRDLAALTAAWDAAAAPELRGLVPPLAALLQAMLAIDPAARPEIGAVAQALAGLLGAPEAAAGRLPLYLDLPADLRSAAAPASAASSPLAAAFGSSASPLLTEPEPAPSPSSVPGVEAPGSAPPEPTAAQAEDWLHSWGEGAGGSAPSGVAELGAAERLFFGDAPPEAEADAAAAPRPGFDPRPRLRAGAREPAGGGNVGFSAAPRLRHGARDGGAAPPSPPRRPNPTGARREVPLPSEDEGTRGTASNETLQRQSRKGCGCLGILVGLVALLIAGLGAFVATVREPEPGWVQGLLEGDLGGHDAGGGVPDLARTPPPAEQVLRELNGLQRALKEDAARQRNKLGNSEDEEPGTAAPAGDDTDSEPTAPPAPPDGDGDGDGEGEDEPGSAALSEVPAPNAAAAVAETAAAAGADLAVLALYRQVQRRSADVRECYDDALLRDPQLEGELQLDFRVDGSGRPRAVRAKLAPSRSRPLERCVESRVKRWRFEVEGGGSHTLRVPFLLRGNP